MSAPGHVAETARQTFQRSTADLSTQHNLCCLWRHALPYLVLDVSENGDDFLARQPTHPQEEERSESPGEEQETIKDIFIDYMDVVGALRKICNDSSQGPDGVLPCLLKIAETSITLMLTNIFQSSFDTGEIPEILKLWLICPIHKCGSTSVPANFRPLSL